MKRYFVLALLSATLLIPSGAFAQVQTGTCPNGNTLASNCMVAPTTATQSLITVPPLNLGENWTIGSGQLVRWRISDTSRENDHFKIELLKGGISVATIKESSNGCVGTLNCFDSWNVPASVVSGADYRVKVSDIDNGNTSGTSDSDFSISASNANNNSPIKVGYNDVCFANYNCEITWTKTVTSTSPVRIDLLKGGVFYKNIVAAAPNKGVTYPAPMAGWKPKYVSTDGKYTWKVTPDVVAGGDYKILITSTTDGNITGTSDNSFVVAQNSSSALVVGGSPVLKLAYDSKKNEASLTLSATISVNAGSSDLNISVDNGFFGSIVNSATNQNGTGNDQKRTVTPVTKLKIVGDNITSIKSYLIPAGTTASFKVQEVFNPLQMFAGSYYGTFAWAGVADGNVLRSLAIDQNMSNMVTVVGEKSPYITSITSPSDVNSKVTITGVRFDTNDSIIIGGMPYFQGKGDLEINSTSMTFTPRLFNLSPLSAGAYGVVISDPKTGNSNSVGLILTGGSVVSTSSITILSPIGGTTVTDDTPVTLTWTPAQGDFNTYAIFLVSSIGNVTSINVTPDIVIPTTSTSATVTLGPVVNELIANNPQLSQSELRRNLSLQVVAMKNTTTGSTRVAESNKVPITVGHEGDQSSTIQPVVSIVGAPTLKLNYDSAKKESSLVASATVKVTAGSADIPLGSNNNLILASLAIGGKAGDTNSTVGVNNDSTVYTLVTSTMAGGTFIPAGASATFKIVRTMSPQQMFAGKYVTWVRTWINDTGSMVGNASGVVTVVGEKSPYISSITPSVDVGGKVTITGVRFSSKDTLYIDTHAFGMSANSNSVKVSADGKTITVNLGLVNGLNIANGVYRVYVSDAVTGDSNFVNLTLTGGITVTQPTASVIGVPTLKLTYDSTQAESSLVADAVVRVNAGSTDLKLMGFVSFGVYSPNLVSPSGQSTMTPIAQLATEKNQMGQTVYTIPAGKWADFTLHYTVNPQQMFAGVYVARFGGIYQADVNNLGNSTFIGVPENGSTPVTVVGEKSPYITSIMSPSDVSSKVTVTGVRFNTADSIIISGTPYSQGKGDLVIGNTSMVFTPKLLNLSAGSYAVVVSDLTTGKSNSVNLTLTGGTPVTQPTVSIVSTPTLKLNYDSTQKESSLVASATVKITAGSQDLQISPLNNYGLFVAVGTSVTQSMSVNSDTTTVTPLTALSSNNYISYIPSGSSVSFKIVRTLNPQQMFAGKYITWAGNLPQSLLGANNVIGDASNAVTVVGEKSPYMNAIQIQPATSTKGPAGTMTGVRLASPMSVLIDSQTVSVNGLTSSGTSMSFTLPVSTTAGRHSIQVSNSTGASNVLWFDVSSPTPVPPTTAPSITVTSPNSGAFTAGSPQIITWTTAGTPAITNVAIHLYRGTTLAQVIIANTSNTGTYTWTIPATLAAGSDYKIRIYKYGVLALYDDSDASFSVAAPGSTTNLSVSCSASPASVLTGQQVSWFANPVGASSGSYRWSGDALGTAPQVQSSYTTSGTKNATVTFTSNGISATANCSVNVTTSVPTNPNPTVPTNPVAPTNPVVPSNPTGGALFPSIIPTSQSVTVTYPNNGETINTGSVQTITWVTSGVAFRNINVYLYKAGKLAQTIITKAGTANNSWTWTVPTTLASGNDYKIRVSNYDNASLVDESDVNFTITTVAPSIAVVYPNGNESIPAGSTQTITWTSAGTVPITSVRISLYKTGVLVLNIVDMANTGSYVWKVPATLAPSSEYKIRIMKYGLAALYDESDANFTVVKATADNVGVNSSLTATIFNATSDQDREVPSTQSNSACVALTGNLQYGANDTFSAGAVSELQGFLQNSGYLSSASTGYFGNQTFIAVKSFQDANGVEATGYVGALTRAKIQEVSCR